MVDSTSTFGNTVRASGAQTITVSGKADIAATISGKRSKTINIDAGSVHCCWFFGCLKLPIEQPQILRSTYG